MKDVPVIYLPGHQLEGVLLEGLHLVQPGRDDLLQLLEAVRLERHPGQTLQTLRQSRASRDIEVSVQKISEMFNNFTK